MPITLVAQMLMLLLTIVTPTHMAVLDEQARLDSLGLHVPAYELRFAKLLPQRYGAFQGYRQADGKINYYILIDPTTTPDWARIVVAHEYGHLWAYTNNFPHNEEWAYKFAYCFNSVGGPTVWLESFTMQGNCKDIYTQVGLM